jgi:hypothetical protein
MKAKDIIFRFIAIGLGFAFALTIVEVGIRIIKPQMIGPIQYAFDPELGEIPVPNQHGHRIFPGVYDYTYNNNSLGFRGNREYNYGKHSNFRILLLGDSFTYGIGVNDDQTFAYHITEHIGDSLGSLEVINAGNAGKGTDYQLKLFQTLGYKFYPNLTILCFFSNNFYRNKRSQYYYIIKNGELYPKSLASSFGLKKSIFMKMPLYNWVISWSHTANLIKRSLLLYLTSISKVSELIVNYDNKIDNFADKDNIEITKIIIRKLNDVINKSGSRFMLVYIPNKYQIYYYRTKQMLSDDEKAIIGISNELCIHYLSLTKALSESQYNVDKLYLKEGHFTSIAHMIAAQIIANDIKDYK